MKLKTGWDGSEANRIYFTSDTHFGHGNIIKYCHRPFETTFQHDEELIRRWNEKVPKDGIVFHLGDVGFGHPKYINSILERLNGTKFLIIGNHDLRQIVKQHANFFDDMTLEANIKINGQHIILNHYPLLCYSGAYRKPASWQLFGHVHSGPLSTAGLDGPRLQMCYAQQYDVGVDNNDFRPIAFNELKTIIEKRENESRLHGKA